MQGSQRLIRLRQELITLLLKGDKLQHARNLAGNALHTLQDFYSRSNWIELGNTLPLNALAQPGSDIWQENIIAGATEPTCRDCLLGEESKSNSTDTCANNLLTGKLTSGYRSGQEIKKPVDIGKCSRSWGTNGRQSPYVHADGFQHYGRKPKRKTLLPEAIITGFCYKSVNFSLEELKNINMILFLIYELFRESNVRNEALF